MLEANVNLVRRSGFGALIHELAQAPLDEVDDSLGSSLSEASPDPNHSAARARKFLPTLLPLPREEAQPISDRRLRMIADTRQAFVSFVSFDEEEDPAPPRRSSLSPSQRIADPELSHADPSDMTSPLATPTIATASAAGLPQGIDARLQETLRQLAAPSAVAPPRTISAVGLVAVAIPATLVVIAAAWIVAHLL